LWDRGVGCGTACSRFRGPLEALLACGKRGATPHNAPLQGLAYDEQTGHFYVVEEVVEQGDTHLHPVAQASKGGGSGPRGGRQAQGRAEQRGVAGRKLGV
jgi:hypothetical protein